MAIDETKKDEIITDPTAISNKYSLPKTGGSTTPQSSPALGPVVETLPGIGTLTRTPKTPLAGTPIAEANPLGENTAGLYARTGVTPPPSYSVVSGDTLGAIASKSGMSLSQLLSLNPGIKDPNKISVGQSINLGGGTTPTTGPSVDDNIVTTPSGAKVNKVTGEMVSPPPGLPEYPSYKEPQSETAITDAYNSLIKSITAIEDKIKSNSTPSEEEKTLAKDLAAKKAELATFDIDLEKRVNNLYGQGRGATLRGLGVDETIERRSSALERLGLATEAQTLTTALGLAKEARGALSEEAKTEYDLAGKRFDIALNLQKEMDKINSEDKDDARQYLLDVVSFAGSKPFEELEKTTQDAIMRAVSNSPITLDMVKTALRSSSEKAKATATGDLRTIPGLGVVQVNKDGSGYTVVVPETEAPAKKVSSGKLSYTEGDISEGVSLLEKSRGEDGWVDPTIYKNMYEKWIDAGGLPQDFVKNYPPKIYSNPANDWLPQLLRNSTKTDSGGA